MAKKNQKRTKLKPVLVLAGVAGGVVAAVRKRGGSDKLQQAASQAADQASDLAERAKQAAPEPVKQAASQAAEKASDLAERAKDAAPEQVKQAVEKVQGGDAAEEETRRYAAPAEAGSQPPAEPDGSPSDDPDVTVARTVIAEDLHTKAHDLPDDVVMPDTSDDDPVVREAEAAAAADAGEIGGNVDGTGESRGTQP